MKWYSHPTYKFHLKEIDSGKLINLEHMLIRLKGRGTESVY